MLEELNCLKADFKMREGVDRVGPANKVVPGTPDRSYGTVSASR